MGSSMLLYLINEENEIPQQPLPNTGYYIISKNEIRLLNSASEWKIFRHHIPTDNSLEERVSGCENKINKIYSYLTSFKGDEND